MLATDFNSRYEQIREKHTELIEVKNNSIFSMNGVYNRYENPILTRDHIPLEWRYDLNKETNPFLMERIGINTATFLKPLTRRR